MEKKMYLIVGDNNFWYATTPSMTEKQALKALETTRKMIVKEMFSDNGANELYLYEAKEIIKINVDKK